MSPKPLLLCFEDELETAEHIARAAELDLATIARHRFPDGEIKLRLPAVLPERLVILRTLHDPNEKLIELLLLSQTARLQGAGHLTLVAPYLAYMRQDMAFRPGEAVSGRQVVLLDDVVSTGRTVAGAARLLLAAGAASVDVAVTHALFVGDALPVIREAGVGEVWSTDSIKHSSNAVSIVPRLAEALLAQRQAAA